jgi:Mg2+ and Co2+ transporter CorA
LAQFFQEKADTVQSLYSKKKFFIDNTKNPSLVDLLDDIQKHVLKEILTDFNRICKRLDSVKSHISTIRSNFEARIASKQGEEQQKTNKMIDSMTKFGVCVVPMNLTASFFGMNVRMPMQGSMFRWFVLVNACTELITYTLRYCF